MKVKSVGSWSKIGKTQESDILWKKKQFLQQGNDQIQKWFLKTGRFGIDTITYEWFCR